MDLQNCDGSMEICRDFLQSLGAFQKINLVDNQIFARISS